MSCILLRSKWPFGPFAFNELISGPRNSFYCLGHFKNVYDDDDDDDWLIDSLIETELNYCSNIADVH